MFTFTCLPLRIACLPLNFSWSAGANCICFCFSAKVRLNSEVLCPVKMGLLEVSNELVAKIQQEFFPDVKWVTGSIR